ncbi:nicotinamide-nucleotide amidohydrolase family protein, partial [Proteus mirabilis]
MINNDEMTHLSIEVGQALLERKKTLTTAESCTGGWIAKVITDIAGSSDYYHRGFVTYSNQAKHDMIGV